MQDFPRVLGLRSRPPINRNRFWAAAPQAVALELGTVFVGAFQDQAVTRALDLPPRHAPMALLPIGYPRD